MTNMTIADEGEKVVLVIDGRRVCDMPAEVARQMAAILRAKADKIQEMQAASQIIFDQAILQRSGSPIGLSNSAKILDEAKKEAQWNRDLRRYMPLNGIEPKAIFGTPSLRKFR